MDPVTTLTAFDIAVLLILGISVIMAFVRGFATVALSLAAWVITIFAVLFLGELATPYMRPYIEPAWLADSITYAVLFFGGLMLLKWAAGLIGGMIKNSPVGFLDRSLGALFGLLRGMVLVSALYFGFVKLFPGDSPEWVDKAQTRPLVQWGAEMLSSVVASALGREEADFAKDYLEKAAGSVPNQFFQEALEEQAAKYGKRQQEELEDLLREKLEEKEDEDDGR